MTNIVRLCRGVAGSVMALLILCIGAPVSAQDLDLSPALRGYVVEDAILYDQPYVLAVLVRRDGDWKVAANKTAALFDSKKVYKSKRSPFWMLKRDYAKTRLAITVGNGRRQEETVKEQVGEPVKTPSARSVTKALLSIRSGVGGTDSAPTLSLAPLTRRATILSVRQDDAGVLHLKLQSPQTPAALAKAVKPVFGAVTVTPQNGASAPSGGGAFTARKTVGPATVEVSVSPAPPQNKRGVVGSSPVASIVFLRYRINKP